MQEIFPALNSENQDPTFPVNQLWEDPREIYKPLNVGGWALSSYPGYW